MAKEGGDAQIRMPSGEVRIVRTNCFATIGRSATSSMRTSTSARLAGSVTWVGVPLFAVVS